VLAAIDDSLPDLAVVPITLGRYDHFTLLDGALVLRCQPEPGAATRVGFYLLPRDGGDRALAELPTVLTRLLRPTRLDLGNRGRADLSAEQTQPWPRLVQVDRRVRTPFLVCERGWWTWRPTQLLGDGSELLRVWQLPGDTVQLRSGQELLASTRPGPGSLRSIALREPLPASVTVRVLESSPLGPPCVTMGADFDAVCGQTHTAVD